MRRDDPFFCAYVALFVCVTFANGARAATDEDNMRDLQLRNAVREDFLNLTTTYFGHMSQQLASRTRAQTREEFGGWQSEMVKEFTIPLRLENRDRTFVPARLTVSLDGSEIGSLHLATGERGMELWKWFNVKLRDVPVGERLLKFSLHGTRGRRAVRIDGFSPVFVTGATNSPPVGLFVESSLALPFVRLSAAIYREKP